MIYNIAVFGSCASRDNFYSGINPDYKKYFNCSISSQRGSIISLMQEPVPFKNQDIQILPENRVNKAGTQFINQDLTKNFLAEVKKFKPDYILIDNYFEVIFGIIIDNILKKQKDVITLKIKKERILDENHEWGLGQVHYTQPYYLNILNQLKQISKNDKSLLSKIYELF